MSINPGFEVTFLFFQSLFNANVTRKVPRDENGNFIDGAVALSTEEEYMKSSAWLQKYDIVYLLLLVCKKAFYY